MAGHYVVHYETGGFVYSTRLAILSPESQSGQRQIEAAVCTGGKLQDFPAFQRLLATDPGLLTGEAVKTNPVQ